MTTLINGRTPEQHAAWNRWHRIVAILLALLLLLLWLIGRGPGHATAGGSCCGTATPQTAAVATPPPAAPAPAAPAAPAAAGDADGDGVADDLDRCPNTPPGVRVGEHGCNCDVTVQLQYEYDSAELTADDKAKLDAVAAQLRDLEFESGVVAGYADSDGDEAYNLALSQRRAQSVLDYLAAQGVAPGRMTAVGYGESFPIADNSTPEGKALNRRAVIRRTDCGLLHAVDASGALLPAAHLFFAVDQSALPGDAAAAAGAVVEYLEANPQAMAVVSGFHDPSGNREHNEELAKNRALAVRDLLVSQGIEQSRIDLVRPIVTTGSGSYEEARRVEVVVRP